MGVALQPQQQADTSKACHFVTIRINATLAHHFINIHIKKARAVHPCISLTGFTH